MGLKRVEERLLRLSKMVEKWNSSGKVPHIERDLALDELREIYDALLNAECGVPYTPAPLHAKTKAKSEPQPVAEPEPHHKVDPIADFDDALDIDALLGLTDEDLAPESEPQTEPTPVAEPESAPAPVAQPEPEPAPAPAPNPGGGLFAIEDIPVRSKSSRKMINLYNSSPSSVEVVPTPTPAPAPTPQQAYNPTPQQAYNPAPQPVYAAAPAQPTYIEPQPVVAAVDSSAPQRLGDVLGSGKKIVGEMQSVDNAPIAPMNKITDLRKAIGINDKFLLLRDLFNGDVPLYERTIDTLNAFEDLDECMIYIVENFRWNPDSEGAKMLVSLIERKLS